MKLKLSACLLLLLSRCYDGRHGENLARKAKVFQVCDDELDQESMLTDGQIDPRSYVIVEIVCDKPDLFVEIFLKKEVQVSHVIVYSGNCDKCSGWDFFGVGLFTGHGNKTKSCGNYPKKFGSTPMRVNCLRSQIFETYRVIRVKQHHQTSNGMAAVSEIEVYQFGGLNRNYAYASEYPQGCYSIINGTLYTNATTTEECKSTCSSNGFMFSAIMITMCHCLDQIPEARAECGDDIYEVFAVRLPWIAFYGCYNPPSGDGYFNWTSDIMTPVKCIIFCANNFKTYSYLKNSDECLCDDSMPTTAMEVDLVRCSKQCTGNDDICGGSDVSSLYTGCYESELNISCTDIYRCELDDFDIYGQCQGPCAAGWGGPYCASLVSELCVTTTKAPDDTFRESQCARTKFTKSSLIFLFIAVYLLLV